MAMRITSRACGLLVSCARLPFFFATSFATYIRSLGAQVQSKPKQVSSPSSPPSGDGECRYRLDDGTSATFALPDGRRLGYAQFGSRTGRAVFYFHGLPGSRIEAAAFHDIAVSLSVRIVAVDRPGIGWSSPHDRRAIVDHAEDVRLLAEHLGLQEYAVLGISGGGPYVLACAATLPPDRLKGAAIVCGLGPPDLSKSGMSWINWAGLAVGYRYLPSATRWWWRRSAAAQLHLTDEERLQLLRSEISNSELHDKDAEIMDDDDVLRLFLRSAREAFSLGLRGFSRDGGLICSDFGFRLEDIRHDLPIQLWYGRLDTDIPAIQGEQLAAKLGPNARLRVEDETHSSLVNNWRGKILEDLVDSM